jgi:hypothetical protein
MILNPWKMAAIVIVLVMATAVGTGLVVARLAGPRASEPLAEALREPPG